MAFEIKKMLDAIKGVRKDWKEDFAETSRSDWKFDFDNIPGDAPGAIPANTVLPVISGTHTVGSVLTVSTGTWTGNPTPTFTYQWTLAGANVVGATTSSYTTTAAGAVTCVVTATNAVGNASVTATAVTIA